MGILALDTSTPAVTAGVVDLRPDGDVRELSAVVTVNARAHGELLTPHLLDAVDQAGLSLADIEAVVCGAGPGPFTGLRAGMVTSAALAHARGIPAYPVCSLDAIAAAAGAGGELLVVTDARRREVYWARYDATGARVAGPSVDYPVDVDAAGAVRAAGHGLEVYPEMFGLPQVEPRYPTPRGLVLAAREALLAGAEPAPLAPLYLRRPDAREPGERKRVTA